MIDSCQLFRAWNGKFSLQKNHRQKYNREINQNFAFFWTKLKSRRLTARSCEMWLISVVQFFQNLVNFLVLFRSEPFAPGLDHS